MCCFNDHVFDSQSVLVDLAELGRGVLAELGEKDGSMVKIKDGQFGVYINWKKVNAKLPVEYADNPETMPLEEAWSLILEKGGGSSKKKSKNGVELPPPPKRPLSAYLHFCAEKRPKVAETVKSLGDVSKELARLWAETTDREPFEKLAAAHKQEYEEKKRIWQEECQKVLDDIPKGGKRTTSATSKARKPLVPPPKRPKSAYLYFCADKRPEVSKTVKELGEVTKELARLWAETAGGEERQQYQELAVADKARYEKEMVQYTSIVKSKNGVAEDAVNGSHVNGKKAPSTKKTSKKTSTRKATRAPSAYMLFCSEHRKTIVDDKGEKLPFGETTKRLAQMWRECDDETRARFQEQAKAAASALSN